MEYFIIFGVLLLPIYATVLGMIYFVYNGIKEKRKQNQGALANSITIGANVNFRPSPINNADGLPQSVVSIFDHQLDGLDTSDERIFFHEWEEQYINDFKKKTNK